MTADLVRWLGAQLDDDERVAKQLIASPGGFYLEAETEDTDLMAVGGHVFRWPPVRVLAEVDAKRRILELAADVTGLDMSVDLDRRVGTRDEVAEPYAGDALVRLLALPYADRAGYLEEWRA